MPSSPAHLSVKTLKYITSLKLQLAPLSTAKGTKSLRALLAAIPVKPPAHSGLSTVPATTLATVNTFKEQLVKVTYSNKQALDIPVTEKMSIVELIRQIEEPAKALRNKDEGI